MRSSHEAITPVGKRFLVVKGDSYASYICRSMRDLTCILKYVVILVLNEQDERMSFNYYLGLNKLGGEFSC